MPLVIHKDSHVDHLPKKVLERILAYFREASGFFIRVLHVEDDLLLPGHEGPVNIVGPRSGLGDPPVPESSVEYRCRPPRTWVSRMIKTPSTVSDRRVLRLTVIAGPHDGHDCVLYTAFWGFPTPKEPNDPTLKDEEREESVRFWSEHALLG